MRVGTPEAGLRAAGAAVARAWRELQEQKWKASRAWEQEEAAVDELLEARTREEECADAAARAREQMWQVRGDAEAMVEDARASGGVAKQRAMEEASGRLQVVVLRVRRADDDLAVAEAEADDAEDAADVLGAVAEGANVQVDCAQEMLRAAVQSAAWLRAVVVVARLRRGRGRQEEMLRVAADVACVEVEAQGGVARATAKVAQVAKLVALEAAAVGAVRREAEWTAAVRSTWHAALARERSRWRAAGWMKVGVAPKLVDGTTAVAAAGAAAAGAHGVAAEEGEEGARSSTVTTGAAAADAAAGVAVVAAVGVGVAAAKAGACGAAMAGARSAEECATWCVMAAGAHGMSSGGVGSVGGARTWRWRRERCRRHVAAGGGDDGGSWRQFDPGG